MHYIMMELGSNLTRSFRCKIVLEPKAKSVCMHQILSY